MALFKWGLLALLIFVLVGLVGLGWYFSDQFLVPQPYDLFPEFRVLAVTADTVTLPPPPNSRQFADTRREGRYNLLWANGYGRLGEVLGDEGDRVVRRFALLGGRLPSAGDEARLDNVLYRSDPGRAHGLAFEELTLQGESGRLRAWWLANGADTGTVTDADTNTDTNTVKTAVLMLHGRRRGDLSETLRIMPTLVAMGYPVLALAYRNHDQSDPSADGLFHYGASEVHDALTALEFLREQGIGQVVLYGFSMGGAIALETAKRVGAEDEPVVRALILDCPLLDVRTVILQGARASGLPFPEVLTDWALLVGRLRTGVDWRSLDQRESVAQVTVPILLIHGAADMTVPVGLADELAARAGPNLRYQRVADAEHTEPWNQDPERYESWVRDFLSEFAPLSQPGVP